MMSFQSCVIPVTLVTCVIFLEATPYGGLMPPSPVVDSSPWMPVAKPEYFSGGSLYSSNQPPYGTRVTPLQSPYRLRAYNSPTFVSNNIIRPTVAPGIGQWVQTNPTTPEAPAASPANFQPAPQGSEGPAASPWFQPAPQESEAPVVNQWVQPNVPEVPASIPSASQELTPIGALPVAPMWMRTFPSSSLSAPPPPPPPVTDPKFDVPAIISPQPENAPVPLQPLPPPPVAQPEIGQVDVIFSAVQDSVTPSVQNPAQDSWPETPRVVPAADIIPALPPATFGQFAVQPAR